jgi:hypothetical protein
MAVVRGEKPVSQETKNTWILVIWIRVVAMPFHVLRFVSTPTTQCYLGTLILAEVTVDAAVRWMSIRRWVRRDHPSPCAPVPCGQDRGYAPRTFNVTRLRKRGSEARLTTALLFCLLYRWLGIQGTFTLL